MTKSPLVILTQLAREMRAETTRYHIAASQQRAQLGGDIVEQFSAREVLWIDSLIEETYLRATAEAYERAVCYCGSPE